MNHPFVPSFAYFGRKRGSQKGYTQNPGGGFKYFLFSPLPGKMIRSNPIPSAGPVYSPIHLVDFYGTREIYTVRPMDCMGN